MGGEVIQEIRSRRLIMQRILILIFRRKWEGKARAVPEKTIQSGELTQAFLRVQTTVAPSLVEPIALSIFSTDSI